MAKQVKKKKDPAVVYRKTLEAMGAKNVWEARKDVPRERAILQDVEDIALLRHIAAPPVLIYESDKPNAVSMPGAVAVATNLMDITTPQELKAVLGHEMSHTRHRWRDMPIVLTISIAVDLLVARFLHKFRTHFPPKNIVTDMGREVIEHVVPVTSALMAVKPYGRHMEYEADYEGGEIAGPQAMAGALKALQKRSGELEKEAELKRHERFEKRPDWQKKIITTIEEVEPTWFKRVRHHPTLIFDVHPPMASRLERMRRMEDEQNASLTSQPRSL